MFLQRVASLCYLFHSSSSAQARRYTAWCPETTDNMHRAKLLENRTNISLSGQNSKRINDSAAGSCKMRPKGVLCRRRPHSKPRHNLRYLSVHFSRPYRPVKGGGGETLRHPVTNCLLVDCLLMPTFCHFCSSFLPLWGEREMVRFATRRTADDDPPSRL